jgi:hypothetical protein
MRLDGFQGRPHPAHHEPADGVGARDGPGEPRPPGEHHSEIGLVQHGRSLVRFRRARSRDLALSAPGEHGLFQVGDAGHAAGEQLGQLVDEGRGGGVDVVRADP